MKIQANINTMLVVLLFTVASFSFVSCQNGEKKQQSNPNLEATNSDEIKSEYADEGNVVFLDESGKEVSLKSLKGKVVFINFWATWCPPCVREMPSINALKANYKDNENIVFLMVDVDGASEKSKEFMTKNHYALPVFTPKSEIPSEFLGNAIPTTVILDKNGNIAARMEGGRDYNDPEMTKSLNSLISQ